MCFPHALSQKSPLLYHLHKPNLYYFIICIMFWRIVHIFGLFILAINFQKCFFLLLCYADVLEIVPWEQFFSFMFLECFFLIYANILWMFPQEYCEIRLIDIYTFSF